MVVGNPRSTSNSNNVSEQIDGRILRLLGLDDVFDLDYETYITLLKEILVKSVVTGKNKLATEEVDLLKDELKRVKGKGKAGRFKVKTKKVSASSVVGGGSVTKITNKKYILNQSTNIISPQKFLPPSEKGGAAESAANVAEKSKVLGDEFENNIAAIRKSVESIANILADQFKFQNKNSERERRNAEGKRRGDRESALEKSLKMVQKVVSNLLAPVKSIWEKILNFIVNTILGRVVFKLIDWFADPNNAKKIRSLIRFFGDWWPALLGAYILFGTSFGKFTSSIIGIVTRGLLRLTKFAIPQLLRFLKSPLGIGLGLFTAGATVPMLFPGTVDEQERKTASGPGSNADKIKELEKQKAALNFFEKLQGKGAEIDEQIYRLKTGQTKSYGFSGGGSAGVVSGQKGTDKIPAMLSDGEFVMSVGAVKKYGIDTLEAMNAAGGGNNTPREINGKVYAQGGGFVGNYPSGFSGGGMGGVSEILNNIIKWFNSQGINIQNPKSFGEKIYSEGKKYVGMGLDYGKQLLNDPKVKEAIDAASQVQKKGAEIYKGVQEKLKKSGYLNEKGQFSGAAKNQATNFLSDLLPNLPFINQLNKGQTSSYLESIGLSRQNARYGDMSSQAMFTGKSGIDSAYNIGQMQLNKMSKESKQIYLKILKERMASGTLKSGDVINPYGQVNKNDPRYREQGSVRFYVDPKTGKGYLLDTYGFDPGKVNLGGPGSAAQKQYEDQVKSFQDPKKKIKLGPLDIPIGRIAKKLDLRPMQDATEGGGLPQYILALRNKIFGYDAQKEGSSLDPKRFKTKAQIDELKELGDLKRFAAKQLTPTQKRLIDEKLKKAEAAEKKRKEEKKLGGGSVKLYDKPQKNTGQPYKSRFARPKNAGVKPPSPPPPKVTVVRPNTAGGGQGGGRGSRSTNRPSHPPAIRAQSSSRTNNTRATHGIK